MTVANVGANVGYFPIWASNLVSSSGRIVAVEPDPANFDFPKRNTEGDGLTERTQLIQAPASDEAGTITLFRDEENCGDCRVFNDASPSRTGVQVPMVQLDAEISGVSVDSIITDTQGWDHRVL